MLPSSLPGPKLFNRPLAALRAGWRRLTAPAPELSGLDERRQAQLMAGLLIVLIPVAILSELLTVVSLASLRTYSGYWVTVVAVIGMVIAYGLSRTRHYRWGATLIVVTSSIAVYIGGVRDPVSVHDGFLDFLLVSLLLGSGLVSLRVLVLLGLGNLVGLLFVPLLNPAIRYETVLVGSFTFNLIAFIIMVFMGRHRDLLEHDRLSDLAEKEARYRTLVELVPAVTYLDAVDPSGDALGFTSLYLSPQVETLLGYPTAVMLAQPNLWWERVHPDDRPAVLAAHADYVRTGQPLAHEYRLIAADGVVHWVRDVASLRVDAVGRRLSQGLWLDTTDAHQAEARLRQEAARTTALLRVAKRLNALLDVDAALATLCEEAQEALAADAAVIMLYDPQRELLIPAASYGLGRAAADLPPLPRLFHDQAMGWQGADVLVPDLQQVPELTELNVYTSLGIRGLAYARVQHEQQLVGNLVVLRRGEPHPFSEDDRLLLRGLADQAALSLINTRLYKDAQRRLDRLQALRAIDVAISSHQDLPETLDVLLAQITAQLDVSAALVLLTDPDHQHLVFGAGRGFRTSALPAAGLPWGGEHAAHAARDRRLVAVPDLIEHLDSFRRGPLLAAEGFVSYFAAPLIIKDEVRGVVELFDRVHQAPDPEWLAFLEALAGQAAIAIDNTSLIADLQHSNTELGQAYDATIEGWSRALDLRDHETEGHTQRVTELTLALAAHVGGFDPAELVHVRRGALLHDIGKMGIPDAILHKPGPLTDEEWLVMRRHPLLAYDLLHPIDYLRPALDIPLSHHEWWDGTGYPHGLAGAAIPRAARLFAIVDVWDALCSDRPYRAAWPAARVRQHLLDQSGTHFDPALVTAFLGMPAASSGLEQPPA